MGLLARCIPCASPCGTTLIWATMATGDGDEGSLRVGEFALSTTVAAGDTGRRIGQLVSCLV